MKNVTINTAAAWVTTFRSWVDGDIFRESNTDLAAGDLADRLGYLKAQEALSAKLAADQTFTGSNTFAGGATETFSVTGDTAAEFAAVNVNSSFSALDEVNLTGPVTVIGDAEFQAELTLAGYLNLNDTTTLADANATIATALARVPTLTADRVYTLPGAVNGRVVILTRPAGSGAFYARLNDPSANEIGRVPASTAGWIVAHVSGGVWKAAMWSSTATNIATT